jgi:hypothetical protein
VSRVPAGGVGLELVLSAGNSVLRLRVEDVGDPGEVHPLAVADKVNGTANAVGTG